MLISVIIPTCNRPEFADRCLRSLTPVAQGLPPTEYEIILTDDSVDSRTRELVAARGYSVRWVVGPRRGPAANRNHGASLASGDWLAFIDDDCYADGGWLRAIKEVARRGDVDVIEGRTSIPDKVDHPLRQGVENHRGGVYWSCNLALRLDIFEKLGRFDEDFLEAGGEDMEFAFRVRAAPIRTRFLPSAHVYHPVRTITWKGVVWRTRLIRWMSLYELKTGGGPSLGASWLRVSSHLVVSTCLNAVRTSWHLFRDFEMGTWKTRLFWQCWNLLMLPFVLPYRLVWEFRFRSMLEQRSPKPAAYPA